MCIIIKINSNLVIAMPGYWEVIALSTNRISRGINLQGVV